MTRFHGDPSLLSQYLVRDLPDGLARLVFMEYANPFSHRFGERSFEVVFAGAKAEIQDVGWNLIGAVGVNLRPGGIKIFSGIPARELTGKIIPLEKLWGKEALDLLERMTASSSDGDRVRVLEESLVRRVRVIPREDFFVLEAARLIEGQKGEGSLGWFFSQMGYSRQCIARKFEDWMGLSPKQYARIVRFNHLFQAMDLRGKNDWARLALDHGYFDQSHLLHDFQDLAGRYPGRFMEEFGERGICLVPGKRRGVLLYFREPSEDIGPHPVKTA